MTKKPKNRWVPGYRSRRPLFKTIIFRRHSDTAATQYLSSTQLDLDKQKAANLEIFLNMKNEK